MYFRNGNYIFRVLIFGIWSLRYFGDYFNHPQTRGVRYISSAILSIVVLTMCNFTILSILQKAKKTPTECTHTLACVVMKQVKQCTSAFRVWSFTAWFSRLKCKIQDMGSEMYIFTFHIVKITQGWRFFFKNKHDYKVYWFYQQFNKQWVNIKRLAF